MTKDLTLLLGVEAREKGMAIFEKFNNELEKIRNHFNEAGDAATRSGAIMTEALGDPTTAGAIYETRLQELSVAQDRLAISTKAFKDATAAAAVAVGDDGAAAKAASVAMREFETSLALANKAELAATDAAHMHSKALNSEAEAQAKANGLTQRSEKNLSSIGPKAFIVAAAVAGIGYESAKAAAEYNMSVVKIANSGDISMKKAGDIGQAFLTMSTQSMYSASELANAYGGVAGQLSTLNGKALTTKQAMQFMDIASQGAAASGQSLSAVASSLSKLMQQTHEPLSQAAKDQAALYNESRLTGQTLNQVTQQVSRAIGTLGILAPNVQQTAALMLDFTEHGMNARRASMVLNVAMNQLLKTGRATVPTMGEVNNAIKSLPKSLQGLANAYVHGKISATTYGQEMKKLSAQTPEYGNYLKSIQTLVTQSHESVKTLNALKLTPVQNELATLGVNVFNSKGQFVGMGSVIDQLGPKFRAMHGAQEQLRVATILFGSQGKAMIKTILASKDGYDKASRSINNQRAVQEAAMRAQETYEASMKKLHNTFSALRIEIGQAFLPVIEKVVGVFAKIVGPIVGFIGHNKKLAAILLTVVGAVSGVIGMFWAFHKVSTVVKDAWTGMKTAMNLFMSPMKKLGTLIGEQIGMLGTWATETYAAAAAEGGLAAGVWAVTWPILAVIAAIALIVLAIYELYKHWHTVWNTIKTVVKDVVHFISSAWDTLWKDIIKPVITFESKVLHVLGGIITWFSKLGGKILGFVVGIGKDLFHAGAKIVDWLIKGIESVAGKIGGAILGGIKKIPVVGGLISGAMSVMKGVFSIFHEGGVVPGQPGENVPAILQAGETVFTAEQMKKLNASRMVPTAGLKGASSYSHNVIVNVTVNGAVYGSLKDFSNALGRQLTTTILPQAGVILPH